MIALGFFLFGLLSGYTLAGKRTVVQPANIKRSDFNDRLLDEYHQLKQQLSKVLLASAPPSVGSEDGSSSASDTIQKLQKLQDDKSSLLNHLAEAKAEAQEHTATHAASDAIVVATPPPPVHCLVAHSQPLVL
jgi:hypothetical protein